LQKNEFELLLIIYTLFFLMFLVAMLLPLLENMALLNFSLVLGSPLRDFLVAMLLPLLENMA